MSASTSPPRAPAGLKSAGRALWRAIVNEFELTESERRLLVEAARCADQLDDLAAVIAEHGTMCEDGRVAPAVIEARLQRLALARLVASLRVPDVDDEDGDPGARPQRRGGARGAYGGRGGAR